MLRILLFFRLRFLFEVKKCCFPLAEARKKRKTFFSHTSGGLGASVRGVRGHMRFPTFLVAVRHCLTCSSPTTLLVFLDVFSLEDSFFHFLFVVLIFNCIRSFSYCSFHIIFWISLFVLL